MLPGLSPVALDRLGDHLGAAPVAAPADPVDLEPVETALSRLVATSGGAAAVRSRRGQAADELLARGVAALRDGDADAAVRELARSVELDPGHAAAWLHLAVAHLGGGDAVAGFEALRSAVRHARPTSADVAATAALVAARLAVAAGAPAVAVEVLTEADALADCQGVVEALVRLAPERDVRLVELAVAHGGAVAPFDHELLGPRGRRYEATLRTAAERALGERDGLAAAASQLRSRFRALATDRSADASDAASFEGVAARLYEAFLVLHDAPRPTRTSTPDLGPLSAEAGELSEKLRDAVAAIHTAQTAAGWATALRIEGPGRRRGRRRQHRRTRAVAAAGARFADSGLAARCEEASRDLTQVDLEGARVAVAELRSALAMVPVRPAPFVRPLVEL